MGMLKFLLKTTAAAAAATGRSRTNPSFTNLIDKTTTSNAQIPATTITLSYSVASFSSKASKGSSGSKGKDKDKDKVKVKGKGKSSKEAPLKSEEVSSMGDRDDFDRLPTLYDNGPRNYDDDDDDDTSLDIGLKGQPLFTRIKSISELARKDVCTYIDLSMEDWNSVLKEGLPLGMTKEFEETRRSALLVRHSFLDLRDNFRRIVDPPLRVDSRAPRIRKQIVLDGPVSCGKSISLAMLVHWARSEGWLVFYVPYGRKWTHGGFFYRNPLTGLWDTPVQAAKILQDFLKYNETHAQRLPCQIFEPIALGEGAGVGMMKGVDSMAMPEGSTLFDLIQTGLTYTHAAVGVVVRLRKELSLVKDIPVLIAIDQYNNWFTFSEYEEPVTVRSCRPIHARELSTVNAFRSMMHDDMMVGAFSHSTAVGKLRKDLPDVPVDARLSLPRYSLDEAGTVCSYYLRQRLILREKFSEEKWKKIFYLSNGNGAEMRLMLPFI